MTDKLPPNLLALFQPRPPLRYIPPSDRAPDDCKKSTISCVAGFLGDLNQYGEEVPYNATESWLQRHARLKAEKKERMERQLTEEVEKCTNLFYFSIVSYEYMCLTFDCR
jgi:U1 small nuclear ribonucleoprotein